MIGKLKQVGGIVLALTASCGQQDPGDEDAGGVVPEGDYYPFVDGASWTYAHSGGSTPWDEEVSMTATQYMGMDAMLLADTPGPSGSRTESILVQDADWVARVHKDNFIDAALDFEADYDPGFARFRKAWLEGGEGFMETLDYERTERDAMGAVLRMGPRSHQFTVEALSVAVDVPAGRFVNCVQILRERVRDAMDTIAEGDIKTFWFCPGVGKTKELDMVVGKVEELLSCDVPGGDCP